MKTGGLPWDAGQVGGRRAGTSGTVKWAGAARKGGYREERELTWGRRSSGLPLRNLQPQRAAVQGLWVDAPSPLYPPDLGVGGNSRSRPQNPEATEE